MNTKVRDFLMSYGIILFFLIIIFLLSVLSPTFRTLDALYLILFHSSVISLIAFGLTLVMITNNFDLSCASLVILSGILSATLLKGNFSTPMVVIFVLSTGVLVGCINGLLVLMGGVNSIIATLAISFILKSISLYIMGSTITYIKDESFIFLGRGFIGKIPVPTIIIITLAVLLTILTFRTKFGRHSYAIGKNRIVAESVGIKVKKITLINFILCSLLASLAGIILVARVGAGLIDMGEGQLLESFSVVFIGLGIIWVGDFQIPSSLIGALFIATIDIAMPILKIDWFKQDVIKGLIVILVIALTMRLKKTEVTAIKKKLYKFVEEESIVKK